MTRSSPTIAAIPRNIRVTPTNPAIAPADHDARVVADVLSDHRHSLAVSYMESVSDWTKYSQDIAACNGNLDDYIRREFYVFVDYLALYFRTGDPTYRDLYVGEKVKQSYWEPESSAEQQYERRTKILQRDHDGLLSLLRNKLSPADLSAVEVELDHIENIAGARAKHKPEILLIGDCLFLDIMAFLVGAALEDGISPTPTFLTTKNPAELRNEIRKLSGRKFDQIFFSPFSYEFAPEYARLMGWREARANAGKIKSIVDITMDNVIPTLDLLTDLFECNIFVHNSAHVRRHNSEVAERLKNVVTRRTRARARAAVNARLASYVQARNAATFDHLFVLDETALLREHGERALGRMFYDSDLQHPAAMGKWLAAEYRDLMAMQAHLYKKKLVVCDLDNTLWKGVIGEGAVQHYADRQKILKQLIAKGVVLAINSKNDPKNVRWDGGVLSGDDFVCSQINWDTKVVNIGRIAQTLNLKTKDFVFIDDRADEREMVSTGYPEVFSLDATSNRSWRLLDLWSRCLPSQGETDRTQFYKQKEQRDSFIHSQETVVEDKGALFSKLGIRVSVRDAGKSDLKRVAELINRTNQFNTNASRTSLKEVTEWLAAGDRRILVVDCGDKFGSMGTISIAILHARPDAIEIPVFVLSCRVFGYGIEDVVVNAVKRLAAKRGVPIVAPFKQTPHNDPCKKVYPDNGFTFDGSAWTYPPGEASPNPTWLTVSFEDPVLG